MALARQGEPEGIVCVTDHQTRGRGRRDRIWESAPGSALMASVLLRPTAEVAPIVTLALGVAAVDAVRAVSGVEAGLKWPNDLVVASATTTDGPADRKLAGILAEADWPAGSDAAGGWVPPRPTDQVTVVTGIGLNVRWLPEPPPELAAAAVSLEEVSGSPVDRQELLVALLVELERRYAGLLRGDAAVVLDAWRERSATLGRRVRVDLGHRDLEGVASDITATGNLVVAAPDGEQHILAVGDVVHLRPLP
jgi:BirA family biotin operon repressor/biotin-[acetyl-CoA-carboxylase] ligase